MSSLSRVTNRLSRGATRHLVAHHARVAQTVDVGGVAGKLQLLQPGHVSRVTCHVTCTVADDPSVSQSVFTITEKALLVKSAYYRFHI